MSLFRTSRSFIFLPPIVYDEPRPGASPDVGSGTWFGHFGNRNSHLIFRTETNHEKEIIAADFTGSG